MPSFMLSRSRYPIEYPELTGTKEVAALVCSLCSARLTERFNSFTALTSVVSRMEYPLWNAYDISPPFSPKIVKTSLSK